jgi:hypothetical protein
MIGVFQASLLSNIFVFLILLTARSKKLARERSRLEMFGLVFIRYGWYIYKVSAQLFKSEA